MKCFMSMRTCHLMMHCAAYIVGTGRERELYRTWILLRALGRPRKGYNLLRSSQCSSFNIGFWKRSEVLLFEQSAWKWTMPITTPGNSVNNSSGYFTVSDGGSLPDKFQSIFEPWGDYVFAIIMIIIGEHCFFFYLYFIAQ